LHLHAVRGNSDDPTSAHALEIINYTGLLAKYSHCREPVIDGLLRVSEIMNVIAPPKAGKTWITQSLAIAVATGNRWLDTFATTQSRVLLIDNELHPETIAHRLRLLTQGLGVPADDLALTLHVCHLRGRLKDLDSLSVGLRQIERGKYGLVVIDAFYRIACTADENDNRAMAALYNTLDGLADAMGTSFALVHHASKGNQADKSVTDVGAGAGAQSRAADVHLIMRQHEEQDAVVLDGAARSWPPITPMCFRRSFPVWIPAPELDPTALRRPKTRPSRRSAEERPPKPTWTAKLFAETFVRAEPQARAAVEETAAEAGLSGRLISGLIKNASQLGHIHVWKERGKPLIATVKPPELPLPSGDVATDTEPAPSRKSVPTPKRVRKPHQAPTGAKARARTPPHPPPVGEPTGGGWCARAYEPVE
jgi:hypothetical protein